MKKQNFIKDVKLSYKEIILLSDILEKWYYEKCITDLKQSIEDLRILRLAEKFLLLAYCGDEK